MVAAGAAAILVNSIKALLLVKALLLMMSVAPAAAADMTDGEVRKVDRQAGKLTLQHGEIKNLGMPGMTMVFAVKSKAMLDKLKPGDKIRFKAVDDAGKLTVTEIQPAD